MFLWLSEGQGRLSSMPVQQVSSGPGVHEEMRHWVCLQSRRMQALQVLRSVSCLNCTDVGLSWEFYDQIFLFCVDVLKCVLKYLCVRCGLCDVELLDLKMPYECIDVVSIAIAAPE